MSSQQQTVEGLERSFDPRLNPKVKATPAVAKQALVEALQVFVASEGLGTLAKPTTQDGLSNQGARLLKLYQAGVEAPKLEGLGWVEQRQVQAELLAAGLVRKVWNGTRYEVTSL